MEAGSPCTCMFESVWRNVETFEKHGYLSTYPCLCLVESGVLVGHRRSHGAGTSVGIDPSMSRALWASSLGHRRPRSQTRGEESACRYFTMTSTECKSSDAVIDPRIVKNPKTVCLYTQGTVRSVHDHIATIYPSAPPLMGWHLESATPIVACRDYTVSNDTRHPAPGHTCQNGQASAASPALSWQPPRCWSHRASARLSALQCFISRCFVCYGEGSAKIPEERCVRRPAES